MKGLILVILSLLTQIIFVGCAHKPVSSDSKNPDDLYDSVCRIGQDVRSTKGSVWLRAASADTKGQFPAFVSAQTPDQLRMEVTNLLGGTEAIITIKGQDYLVDVKKKKNQSQQGSGSWAGIPLRWATDLFLGKVPCPKSGKATLIEGHTLQVVVEPSTQGDFEKYTYRLKSWAGTVWPESLQWERIGTLAQVVDFKFDEPESETHSPKKWEIKSTQGEIKVRWRDREIIR